MQRSQKYMIFRLLTVVLISLPISVAASSVEVYERTFKNGLKILVKEDHRSPVVVSQVWYKVGSSYESGGVTGISHMLEHMMFKGTESYPIGEFSRIIAENGGRENAFTGRDYTAYFQTLEKSRLAISFKLEADRMQNLRLNVDELKKEREVVTEERRMRVDDKPRSKTKEFFMAMAFANSPYKNPVIGWPSDIKNYQLADLQNWYQRWYVPNNATLVVVGDVEKNEVFMLAEKYFSKLKSRPTPTIKPQTEIEQWGVRKTTIKLPAKLPYILMAYKVPVLNTSKNEAEVYALEVLAGILGGGDAARLPSKLIRDKQIAVSTGVSYNLLARLPELFMLNATPTTEHSVSALEYALKAEILLLKNELVSAEELQRVKAQVLAESVYEKDSNFYQAMQLGLYETVGIGWKKADEYVQKINQITAHQVRAVARQYLLEDKLTIAYLDPLPMADNKQLNQSMEEHHVP